MIKTRFAPSPTGFLHVGGLRTALYSYCFAKKNKGKFVLRVEDTDQKRLVEGAAENLLKTLYTTGLAPDEGVILDADKVEQKGDNGPYFQSQRLEIYKKYADQLLEKGYAYRCFCTEERLQELRETQLKNKLAPGYDGCCRKINHQEAAKRASAGEKHVIRMKMPEEGETVFKDIVRGEVKIKNELVDDQVLVKSDGFPTYHLAVVVDDHLMGITHIIRGEEWLSSTPKHIQLYKYFDWEIPQMAHLPLILNPDKSKLSKRQGDVAVEDYLAKGYLAEAIVNFVAFLGWNPGDEKELFDLKELIKEFSLERVGKAGAVFNLDKLNWFNKEYIKNLSDNELVEKALPFFDQKVREWGMTDKSTFAKILNLEKERIATLAELPQTLNFVFELPEYDSELLVWKKSTNEELKKILPELKEMLDTISVRSWKKEKIEKRTGEWIQENNYSNGSVLWPLRIALSGQKNSPGPFEIAEVLGKEEVMKRLEKAAKKHS